MIRLIISLFLFVTAFLTFFSAREISSAETKTFTYLSSNFNEQSSSSVLLLDEFLDSVIVPVTPTPEPDFCMNIPVFLYHHTQPLQIASLLGHAQLTVDSSIFDEQIKYLVNNKYNIISAEDLVYALQNYQKLPDKTVVITIDDGYEDNYTYAFSIAKKYKIIINFMIPTDLIGRSGYMTWDHLKEMSKSQYARIYNHTASHAALGYSSLEQIEWELSSSSEALKNNLGLNNTIFTYPYGSYNDLVIGILKNHGFTGAFTTIEGKTQCKSQVMLLQRMHIGNAPLNTYGI